MSAPHAGFAGACAVFPARDTTLLRFLCEDRPPEAPDGVPPPKARVLILCVDLFAEHVVADTLQSLSPTTHIRVERLPRPGGSLAPPMRLVQLQVLLKAAPVLVASWSNWIAMLEALEGTRFSMSDFRKVALWDFPKILELPNWEEFLRPQRNGVGPQLVAVIPLTLDPRPLRGAVAALKGRGFDPLPVVYVPGGGLVGAEVGAPVPLSEPQRRLYDAIAAKAAQLEALLWGAVSRVGGGGADGPPPPGLHWARGTYEAHRGLRTLQAALAQRIGSRSPMQEEALQEAEALLPLLQVCTTALKVLEATCGPAAARYLQTALHPDDPHTVPTAGDPGTLRTFALSSPNNDSMMAPWGVEHLLADLTSEADTDVPGPLALECMKAMVEFQLHSAPSSRVLVVCWCKEVVAYLATQCSHLQLSSFRACYFTEGPEDDDAPGQGGEEAPNRRLLLAAIAEDGGPPRHSFVLTTRHTVAAVPGLHALPWAEVWHFDADIYSIHRHLFTAGWPPQVAHRYFYTDSSEGSRQLRLDDRFLGVLEDCFPDVQHVDVSHSRPAQSVSARQENDSAPPVAPPRPAPPPAPVPLAKPPSQQQEQTRPKTAALTPHPPPRVAPTAPSRVGEKPGQGSYRLPCRPPTLSPPSAAQAGDGLGGGNQEQYLLLEVLSQFQGLQMKLSEMQAQGPSRDDQVPQLQSLIAQQVQAVLETMAEAMSAAGEGATAPGQQRDVGPASGSPAAADSDESASRSGTPMSKASSGNLDPEESSELGDWSSLTDAERQAKLRTLRIDRARRQLEAAGEYDKLSQRRPPPQPWPLAIVKKPHPFNEADAKQIYNHNHQRLYPKTPPTYFFYEKYSDDNVHFQAETDLYCRIPTFEGDLVGEPRHVIGRGESATKKDAQKAAAIDMLDQLSRLWILHVPGIYKRRLHGSSDESNGVLHVKKVLADRCIREWNTKPTYDPISLVNSIWSPAGYWVGNTFECVARIECPWMRGHFFTATGRGVAKKDAERDAAQHLLTLLLPYFEDLDKERVA